MMTWNEVMSLFGSGDYSGFRTEAGVMRTLLEQLGSPEKKIPFLHIAGTNGKGSASRMLQQILSCSGYRTGLYISPHLEFMNERWSIDGTLISDAELRRLASRVREVTTDAGVFPTAFELLTMMAFLFFAEHRCDIAVLEVGIGGLLDATNVIPVPECAVIMNIGLEHTELLGNTLQEIAEKKGGIIKENGRVVLYHQTPEAETVIRRICAEKNATLCVTSPDRLLVSSSDESGSFFSYREHHDLTLSLAGAYQLRNALAVLDCVDLLRKNGRSIPEAAIRSGLACSVWPGRFEILSKKPLVILDGAHNPNGITALLQNLLEPESFLSGRRFLFVLGIMEDKDYPQMLALLAPHASGFFLEAPENARAASAATLKNELSRLSFSGPVFLAGSVEEALSRALHAAAEAPDYALVCCGSLFQVAAVRHFFKQHLTACRC